MAIGDSRYEAKKAARKEAESRGEHVWAFTTGRIHSHKTRVTYQEQVLRFVNWAREQEGIKTLEDLDAHARELTSQYLQQEIAAQKSPYTLQMERSALRMFFGDRALASDVPLPRRAIADIKRSRGPAVRDRHFQPANWQALLNFQRAVGLRRDELARIKVEDVHYDQNNQLVAYVRSGKGGKERNVPVLPGRERDVLGLVEGRKLGEVIFAKLPDADLHSYRREYAQALYHHYAPDWPPLPPANQRLKPADYNRTAAMQVSCALGHARLDVVLRDYLR